VYRNWIAPIAASALAVGACSSGSASPGGVGSVSMSGLCAQLMKLSCSEYSSQSECEADLAETEQSAAEFGCTAQLDATVACYNQHPPTCGADGDIEINEVCWQSVLDYIACDPTSSCSGGGSSTSCGYSCGDYAVACDADSAGGWNCSCTGGPKTGTTFTPTDGDGCDRDDVMSYCR
jgi:hypothetical protein